MFGLQLEGTGVTQALGWAEVGDIFQHILEHVRVQKLVAKASREVGERQRLEAQDMSDVTFDVFVSEVSAVIDGSQRCSVSQEDYQ